MLVELHHKKPNALDVNVEGYLYNVRIKTDAKFLPTVAGTGLFKWARKSRILLTEKLPVLFFCYLAP